MHHFLRATIAIASIMLLSSCGVFMTKPFPPRSPAVDQERLSGTWILGSDFHLLEFDESGVGHLGRLLWNGTHYTTEVVRIFTAAGPVHHYMAIEYHDDSTNNPLYAVHRYSFSPDGRQLFLWDPDMDVFERAIQEGALEGTVIRRKKRGESSSDESTAVKSMPSSIIVSNEPSDVLSRMDSSDYIACFQINTDSVAHRFNSHEKKEYEAGHAGD